MPEQIPVIPSEFNYRISTTLDGSLYLLDFTWNSRDDAWYMDVLDSDESPIRMGLKLVLGQLIGIREIDERFPIGKFMVLDTSGQGNDPGFDDLGARVVLVYFTKDDLIAELAVISV